MSSKHPNLRRLIVAGGLIVAATGVAAIIAYRSIPLPLKPPAPHSGNAVERLVADWQKNPGDIRAAKHLAGALEGSGRSEDAVDVLLRAIKATPRSTELYQAIGTLYLHHDYPTYALDAFHNELVLNPKSAAGHAQYGVALFYLDKHLDAITHFKRALELDPKDPEPYLGMAFALNALERVQEGIAALQEYIKRAKNPGPGYALLSRIYLNMRVFRNAVDAGKQAVTHLPDNAGAWYNLGEAYSYQPGVALLPEAEKAFRQAIKIAPNDAANHFELGWALQRMERDDEAIAEYEESLKRDPERAKVYSQLYKLQMKKGLRAEAAKSLAKAKELLADNQRENQLLTQNKRRPMDPEPLYQLGKLYIRRGKYSRAVVAFKAVLDREPGSRRAHEGMAEAFAAMGNQNAARREREILGGAGAR